MQFKVGDSVKFLNATGSGKVLRILGGDKIEVEEANKKSIELGRHNISNLDTYLKNHSKFWKG